MPPVSLWTLNILSMPWTPQEVHLGVLAMHVGQYLCLRSADPLSLGRRCCGQRGAPQFFMLQDALIIADPLLSGPRDPMCR